MASPFSLMPFLRPLGPPRATTIQRFLRFSTTSRRTGESAGGEDPNLVASRTAEAAYPPSSFKSLPRPKISRASQRTSHPRKERPYPSSRPSHNQSEPTKLISDPVEPLEDHLCAPNLSYFVNRTSSNELPIYKLWKNQGGSLLLTHVKKIDGSVETLRNDLVKELKLKSEDVTINPVTRHILIKGHIKHLVQQFLWRRKF